MNRIIYQRALLRCEIHRAFEMFTVNEAVQLWLAPLADVEPHVHGKYELFWDLAHREDDSTIGCQVTAIEQDRFLSFEWKGPTQYRHFMNDADPLTQVLVFFVPGTKASAPETEVFLFHSGWRSSGEWEEARQWFERAWRVAFEQLEHRVNASSP